MSTNLGMGLTTNFKKKINPIILNSYKLITDNVDIGNVESFNEFLHSESLSNKVLTILQSLDTHGVTDTIENDSNPLDNIIRAEVIELLNYRKISKSQIQKAIDQNNDGQEPHLHFSNEENLILVKQAFDLEYITQIEYDGLINTPTMLYYNSPSKFLTLLKFQLALPNSIPTLDELKLAGLTNHIIETINNNPEILVDEQVVKNYVENYIKTILLTSEFIGYTEAAQILADPVKVLNVLGRVNFKNLLNRTRPYLNFITDEKIEEITTMLPSQYPNILNLFSREQLRAIIDKELDIKNMVLKTLSLTEVQRIFTDLANQFKIDFTESFTEEKLKELITITIGVLYPLKSNTEIYTDLCENYNIDPTSINIEKLEEQLLSYYL